MDVGGLSLARLFEPASLPPKDCARCRQHQLGVFEEALTPLVLIDAQALVFNAGEATAKPQDQPAAGEMIEQGNLLGDAHRVVPRQHHYHRPELGACGLRRHIGEELEDIRTHGVVGEVVLHRPDGVEPQGLGHLGQSQFLAVDLCVGETVAGVLKQRSKADVHEILLAQLVLEIIHTIKPVLHTDPCRRVILSLEHCRGRVKHSLIVCLQGRGQIRCRLATIGNG